MRQTSLDSFAEVLYQFKEASQAPFDNKIKWLHLQEQLLQRLTRIEGMIRTKRRQIKNLKALLGDANHRLEKSTALQKKAQLKKLKAAIEEHEQWYLLYKSIGDGIAFTFINRHDLKPQFFKESPGFISGKKGTRMERKCLRAAFGQDTIALMNDLTHVMKYGDISLIFDKDLWRLVEVKSGKNRNARGDRQNEHNKKLMEYILNDVSADLYNLGAPMTRVKPVRKWKTNEQLMEKVISTAKAEGLCIHKFHPAYYVTVEYRDYEMDLEEVMRRMKIKKPFVLFQNEPQFKYHAMGLTPYCLTFLDITHYIDFLKGDVRITHFIDLERLTKYCERRGYRMIILDDPNYFCEFQPITGDDIRCRISRHYFLRVFLEFVDITSIISDTLLSFYKRYPDASAFTAHPSIN